MDFNFFQWIREGVRQSVLLGVSDAMGQIGTPDSQSPLHESLQKVAAPAQASQAARVAAPQRKRLGKSLKEINAPAKTA